MAKKATLKAAEDRTPQEHFNAVRIEARERLNAGRFHGFADWFVDRLLEAPGFPRLGNTVRMNGTLAEDNGVPGYDAYTALEAWMQRVDDMIPEDAPEAQEAG